MIRKFFSFLREIHSAEFARVMFYQYAGMTQVYIVLALLEASNDRKNSQ